MKKLKSILYPLITLLIIIVMFWRKDDIKNFYYRFFFEPEVFQSNLYNHNLNYRLFTPKNQEQKKVPLILYLHPWGNNGDDNKNQITNLAYTWVHKKNQKRYPSYVVVPQCPKNTEWVNRGDTSMPFTHYNQDDFPESIEMKMTIELINKLISSHAIDEKKVYVVGYSMGATGCWDILTRHSEVFAASVIASGVSDTTKASKITHIPIWTFSGENDHIAPAALNKAMVEAVNNAGGNAKLTIFPNEGHSIGYKAFNYPAVKEWLFLQSK